MSLPEVLLWQQLRLEPHGVKFRRQHPVTGYVLDFYCARAKLAVEIDGKAHDHGDRPGRDGRRDAALAAHGLTIMRMPASDVLADVEAAAEAIVAAALPLHHRLRRRSPSPSTLGEDLNGHQPAVGPPPRTGEKGDPLRWRSSFPSVLGKDLEG